MTERVYLWLDLETTGLDPRKDLILEIAVMLTDPDGKVLAARDWTVSQQYDHMCDKMNDAVLDMHTQSGLIKDVERHGDDLPRIAAQLCDFIHISLKAHHRADATLHLAGNSVHFDRRFLRIHMPWLDNVLHHRILDVSAFKLAFPVHMEEVLPPKAHRAMADVESSLNQFRHMKRIVDQYEVI